MTNKERLEANNAKIEAIQETLKNKILALKGGETIEIELPEAFRGSTEIYHFQVDDNTILLSTDVTLNIGVWIYKLDTKECYQAYSAGVKWCVFFQTDDGCFIGNDNYWDSKGILFYDNATQSISMVYDQLANWNFWMPLDNGEVLISGNTTGSGVVVCNPKERTFSRLWTSGAYTITHKVGGKYLIADANGRYELLVYDPIEKTISAIIDTQNHYITKFMVVKNKCFMATHTDSSKGLWVYNPETNVMEKKCEVGSSWQYFKEIGDLILIFSGSANGLLLYDNTTDDVTILSQSLSVNSSYVYALDNYVFVSSTTSAALGVYLLNLNDKTFTQIYDLGFTWQVIANVNDIVLLSAYNNYANCTGILMFDIASFSMEKIWTESYRFSAADSGNYLVLLSMAQGKIVKFKKDTKEISNAYSSGQYWRHLKVVKNGCLITIDTTSNPTSSSQRGVLFFDDLTGTTTQKFSNGYRYDIFTEDGDNCFIECSDKTINKNILYYNATDNSVKRVKYYLGELK